MIIFILVFFSQIRYYLLHIMFHRQTKNSSFTFISLTAFILFLWPLVNSPRINIKNLHNLESWFSYYSFFNALIKYTNTHIHTYTHTHTPKFLCYFHSQKSHICHLPFGSDWRFFNIKRQFLSFFNFWYPVLIPSRNTVIKFTAMKFVADFFLHSS